MRKLTYEQMEMAYELALEFATKALFEDNFQEHGWTKEEFMNASVEYSMALEQKRFTRWVN
jgi:hypothetical protein